jgi:UDP-glucose 4-epimerase
VRCLITGGAGFIGAALANRLIGEGHHVRVLDDLSAGDLSHLDSQVLFTRGDLKDVPKLWTLLQHVDCVYHLAARVSVPESILYPRDYNDVNVGGTVAIMEAVRDAGVKRVVLASSGAVYGEKYKQPVSEKTIPNPRSPYAVSKIASEHYVSTIGALCGIETVALRIFNAYGPGQFVPASHAPVIPQFLKQALGGGSLIVFGDGNQTRDFVYIDDVVDALFAAGTASDVDRRIINVGSGREVSINQLVEKVARATGREVNPLYSQADNGGVSRLVADIGLARRMLGYSPKVDLDRGLELMLDRDPQFGVAVDQ